MSAVSEVLPGIYRIELPLPFELASVNIHLLRLERGWLLIDCGMQTDESFGTLSAALAEIGVDWKDIRRILITHTHSDHAGLSGFVAAATGAELSIHAEELRQLTRVNTPELRAGWIDRAFTESGVPEDQQARMQDYFQTIRRNFAPVRADQVLEGGETIATAVGDFEVAWTPGHAPGHVALYSKERRLLLSGDQILPRITPNISWMPERDTLADYLESLATLAPLDIDLILPSHGQPFSGHREWIAQTKRHHERRCGEILANLRASPKTGYELALTMFPRPMSAINRQFALLEILSHLEYLRRRTAVTAIAEGPIFRWFVGAQPPPRS